MGSTVLRQAQLNGQVDLYWEYTGTSLITYNKITDKLTPQEAYQKVKQLDGAQGLVWLTPSKVDDTYALAMRASDATRQNISTLSDLAKLLKTKPDVTVAASAEFAGRPDGLRSLQQVYGFSLDSSAVRRMDAGLTYVALRDSRVDVAQVMATDGRIPVYNLLVLKDDKQAFPAYSLTPVVRKAILDANPKLREQMDKLAAALDQDTMKKLNARVDVDKVSIPQVASDFLKQAGLEK